MKQRIFAILLALALLVTGITVIALATGEEASTYTTEVRCPCHRMTLAEIDASEDKGWVEFAGALENGVHYRLTEDYSVDSGSATSIVVLAAGSNVKTILNLNGNTLTNTRAKGGRLMSIADCEVTICGGGEIKGAGNGGGVIFMNTGSTVNLYDATLTNTRNSGTEPGGVVAVGSTDAVFNMYSGTLNAGMHKGNGGAVSVRNSGEFNMYGGIIDASSTNTTKYGCAVYVHKSSFNMEGGTINGGTTTTYGGAVYLAESAQMTMNNGTITGGSAGQGGNIYITAATAEINGGTVSKGKTANATYGGGNILITGASSGLTVSGTASIEDGYADATSNDNNRGGGNIFIVSGTVNIDGGTIKNGRTDASGGNIMTRGGTLKINGGTISGGTAGSGADYGGNSIALRDNTTFITGGTINSITPVRAGYKALTISGAPAIENIDLVSRVVEPNDLKITLGELNDGADIGITKTLGVAFATSGPGNAQYFFGASERSNVVEDNGSLMLVANNKCSHCGKDQTWSAWTGGSIASIGEDGINHFFLTKNVTGTGRILIGASSPTGPFEEMEVCIDLYGRNISKTGDYKAFYTRPMATLNLMNSSSRLSAVNSGAESSGVIYMEANGVYGSTVRLYDNITVSNTASIVLEEPGSVVYAPARSNFEMMGGTIIGHENTAYDGAVYITDGTFNMYGGNITGAAAKNGGAVYLAGGTFDMSGGTITGSTVTGNGGAVYIGSNGEFNMTGGEIVGGSAQFGGSVYVIGTSFNMASMTENGVTTSGTIRDGKATNRGGNIYIGGDTTAEISGGTVSGGKGVNKASASGGNICVTGCLTISGAALIENGAFDASTADDNRGGGNISNLNGTLIIEGGIIRNGTTNACGGNILSRGDLTISGGTIEGGTATTLGNSVALRSYDADARDAVVTVSGGNVNDIMFIRNGVQSFTVSGAPFIGNLDFTNLNEGVTQLITLGEGGVTGGRIAVNVNEGVPFSIECSDDAQIVKSSVNYFRDSNQNSDLTVGINDNNQLVLAKYATCKHCSVGDNAEKVYVWTAIQDTTLQDVYSGQKGLPEGHYYLRGNHTEDTRIVLRSLDEDSLIDSDMLCLDLNGYTYTKNGNQAFWIRKYTTLSIMDLSANKTGKMIGKFSSTSTNAYGSIAYMNADESEFNLYSGTLEYAGTGVYCGGIVGNNGGEVTINILGGKLIGGKASQNGGNIYASQAATLNISGNAIISGGTVNGETNDVQANGACTISDCAIGTVKLKGTATLSGAPVIELLDLTNAGEAAVTVNNLIADSSITVNAKRYTPFTVQNSNIAELKDYFKSCDEELLIAVNDNDQLYFYREEFKAICYCTDHYNNGNGTEITWTDIENTKFEKIDTYLRLYSGHYYLPDDFTAPERVVVQKLTGYDTSKVVVNLNGHDWKYSNKQIMPFWVRNTGATLTVCDTSTNANGRILGYAGDGAGGGVIRVTGGGQFDLRSGTLAYVGAPATASGGVLYVANGCTFNMYGGKLVGGSTTGSGAAIYADGKLNLQGGEIEQGYATINKIAEQPNKIRLAGRYAELTLNSKLYDAFAGMIHAATNVNDDEMVGVGLGLTDDGWLWYPNVETLAEAYQDGNNFIRLMPNGITDIQINGVSDYYIDINGIDNAVVHVPSDSKIFWMDTANNDFDAMISNPDYVEGGSQPEKIPDPDSCGYITADPGMAYSYAPNGKWYITVKNGDDTYSFHCLEMELVSSSIRSSVGGVYYTAVWNADTVLAGQLSGTANYDPLVTGYGIALTKGNVSINDFITKGAFTYFDNMEGLTNRFLYNTRDLEINSCVLKNIVSVNNTAEANRVNAQTKINAAPFIYFEDYTGKITTLVGEESSSSFAEMIELAAYYATDDAAKAKLQTLYESWVVGEGAYKLGEEFCATTLPKLYALLAPASESQGS